MQMRKDMRAVVQTQYGAPEVLQLTTVEKPTPKDNEVRIKIHATSVTAAECLMRKGEPLWGRVILGFTKPRRQILGLELAGEIEAVGKAVRRFRAGDAVFGFTGFRLGAYAEYACLAETGSLAIKPMNTSYEEAAATVDGASTAFYFLKQKANIQRRQKVLIIGASGSIGVYAVQLAKYFGAAVTGICSTGNIELVRTLGADKVIDYTQEDFTQNGQRYDWIMAANGYHPISDYRRALSPNGTYVMTGGSGAQMSEAMLQGPWISMTGSKKMSNLLAKPNKNDLAYVKDLLEARKIKPVIDSCYPLSEVPEAFRYIEAGHAKGKVVINVVNKN